MAAAVVDAVTSVPSAPPEFFVLPVVATPILLATGVGFLVLFTTISAQFADWATSRPTRDRRLSERSEADVEHVTASRWWLPVAFYLTRRRRYAVAPLYVATFSAVRSRNGTYYPLETDTRSQ